MIPNFPSKASPTIAYSHPMELATEQPVVRKSALTHRSDLPAAMLQAAKHPPRSVMPMTGRASGNRFCQVRARLLRASELPGEVRQGPIVPMSEPLDPPSLGHPIATV
jgi:hypothetical protein